MTPRRLGLIALSAVLMLTSISCGERLQKSRMFAQETAAIQVIRTLHTAEVQYSSQFGRFAASLTELGPPASGGPTASAADIIDSSLASGRKNGYTFTLTGSATGYQITAVPDAFGVTGSRTFFSDQTMVIHENDGPEPATANSKELDAK